MKKQRTERAARRSPRETSPRRQRPNKKLDTALEQLLRVELVRPAEAHEHAYVFKHALVQDTVHATLLKNENKRLHLLVAGALEQVNAEQLDEYAAALARHFAEGEDDAKALSYSIRAGDNAARVFANEEGLAHYARAIEIARRNPASRDQIIHLYGARGRILEVTGKYPEALATYLELHTLAEARQDRALELAALMMRAPLHSAPLPTFDGDLAKQLLLDALGTARELGDQAAEARVLWNLSLLSVHTMHPADGVMYGELSLALAEKLNLREQCAYTLHDLFIPYRSVGQIERARVVQAQARALFREFDDKPMLTDNLGMSAQFAMYEGRFEDAITYAIEGETIGRAVGNPFGIIFNGTFLANIYLEYGETDKAFQVFQDQIDGLRSDTVPFNAAWVGAVIGLFCAQIGAFDLSLEMAQYARAFMRTSIPPVFREGLAALLGRIRLLHGDLEGAGQDLAASLPIIRLGGALQPGVVYMPLAQAELALALGKFSEALAHLQPQAEWARANQYRMLLPENLLEQAYAMIGLGEMEQAAAVLQEAQGHAQEMGMRRMLWQILAAMATVEREQGNRELAASYSRQAGEILEYILVHTPGDLKDRFSNLPRVREVLA